VVGLHPVPTPGYVPAPFFMDIAADLREMGF
jgi:hypothetical protein